MKNANQSTDTGMANPKEKLLTKIALAYKNQGGVVRDEYLHLQANKISLKPLVNVLRTITSTRRYTHLPRTLGSDFRLPIASMYVELSISRYGIGAQQHLIGKPFTLAAEIEAKQDILSAKRIPIHEVVENSNHKHIVILGDPGSGKTSLMRYLCLEIAKGNSERWLLPIFVSLREYWYDVTLNEGKASSLFAYACRKLWNEQNLAEQPENYSIPLLGNHGEELQHHANALEEIIIQLSGKGKKHVLFIIDGFDEIASNRDAIEFVTREINTLSATFSWVLTSRYTGFYGGVDEDERYEMVSLNQQSIEELALNWFDHVSPKEKKKQTKMLVRQLQNNPRSLMMARNPFLLTLLCLLQHRSGSALPLSRAAVYKAVIDLVRVQARNIKKDQSVLSLRDIHYLSDFCFFLYADVSNEIVQLFDRDLWGQFAFPKKPLNLDKKFLPSRLLTALDVEQNNFHFVHLTFQEYFVARALSEKPFESIEEYLYNPSWRMVIRFVASILWEVDRKKFDRLVGLLAEPVDHNGFMHIELAWILSDVGIEDSTSTLGFDLRDEIMDRIVEGSEFVSDAAAEVLAVLSPDYAISSLKKLLGPKKSTNASSVTMQEVEEMEVTRQEIFMLVHIFTPEADKMLVDLLTHEEPAVARSASIAISQKNTPELREVIMGELDGAGDSVVDLLAKVASRTQHHDFLPWIFECVSNLETYKESTRKSLCNALEMLASPEMENELLSLIQTYNSGCCPQALGRGFIALDTDVSRNWLTSIIEKQRDQPQLIFDAIEFGMVSNNQIISLLEHSELRSVEHCLNALLEFLKSGGQISDNVTRAVEQIAFTDHSLASVGVSVLSIMEFYYRMNDRETGVDISHYRTVLESDDPDKLQEVVLLLAQLEDVESVERIKNLALSSEHEYVQILAVNAFIYYARSLIEVNDVIDLYAQILADIPAGVDLASSPIAVCIYDAIGEIDFRQLISMGDTPEIFSALARACAMEGVLIFDEKYIDFDGSIRAWDYPRLSELPSLDSVLDVEDVRRDLSYLLNRYVEKGLVSKSGVFIKGRKKPPLFKGNHEVHPVDSVDKNTGKRILQGKLSLSENSINKTIDWFLRICPDLLDNTKIIYDSDDIEPEKHRYHIIIAVAYQEEDAQRLYS